MNETTALAAYSFSPPPASIAPKGKNYLVTANSALPPVKLERDVDFGVIPKTKKPSLYKPGAEKIALAYGLTQHYTIESKIEQIGKDPLFYYAVRCDLVKIIDGTEYIITSSYGSANTSEKRNGFNSPWDAANGTLKMAQKRALVGAAIALSGCSGMFSQDMENEDFMQNAEAVIAPTDPESPITKKQIMRLYAIAGEAGLTSGQAKQRIVAMGFASTKDIKQKDYESICEKLSALAGAAEGGEANAD